jgi:hypothetical protein
MIFAQIDPVASIINQTDPFNTTVTTGSYMSAIARPYYLGASSVNFQVTYGNCTFDDNGSVTDFQTIFNGSCTLAGSAIQSWGIDDSIILNEIAAQQGTSVVAVVSGSNFNYL